MSMPENGTHREQPIYCTGKHFKLLLLLIITHCKHVYQIIYKPSSFVRKNIVRTVKRPL